jgi:hypothetical protein
VTTQTKTIHSVVEVADPPAGLVELKVRDWEGNRIAFLQVKADLYDDGLVDALTQWQARHCQKASTLSLVRS